MTKRISQILIALIFATTLAGCGAAVKQETAMEWMARQPALTR